MEFSLYSFRGALELLANCNDRRDTWGDLQQAILEMTDEEIVTRFSLSNRKASSLSESLRTLITEKAMGLGWLPDRPVVKHDNPEASMWTASLMKPASRTSPGIVIDFAFDHHGNLSRHLLKPCLSATSTLGNSQSTIGNQGIGVIFTATSELRSAGGFDGAVTVYERAIDTLDLLYKVVDTPLVIIGLQAPKTFRLEKTSSGSNIRKIDSIL